jgi:hypothetical protein
MISLVSVPHLLQLSSLTPQPRRKKTRFRRDLSYLCEHCIDRVRRLLAQLINASFFQFTWKFSYGQFALRLEALHIYILRHQITGRLDSPISASQLVPEHESDIRPHQLSGIHPCALLAATCAGVSPLIDGQRSSLKFHAFTQSLLPSKLSADSSSDTFIVDPPPCLVCDSQSSGSCPVCDHDFCSNHLYRCADCDNQCCGRCFDDHRANGHWTDSDAAAELSHAHSGSKHVAAQCHVSAMSLSSNDHSRGPSSLAVTVSQCIALLCFRLSSVRRYLFVSAYALPQCILLREALL